MLRLGVKSGPVRTSGVSVRPRHGEPSVADAERRELRFGASGHRRARSKTPVRDFLSGTP